MKIQPASVCTAYSYLNIASRQKQVPANGSAIFSSSSASISNTTTISQAAKDLTAGQAKTSAPTGNSTTAIFDTDQGTKYLDIDAYFSNGAASSIKTLPPLLLPTQKNVDALASHISATFPKFLAENNIPDAPASITYDNEGKMQLPTDYPYASELKQALENSPMMDRELRTINALASHVAGIKKVAPFLKQYAAVANQAEAEAIAAKYGYLFSSNRHSDAIALQFSANGSLSLTADGKPLS